MPTASIIGCAGYTGQETLDRVLAHPELEAVALGSNSHAGKPASALDPRLAGADLPQFVTQEEALAAGAHPLLPFLRHAEAAALPPPGPRGGWGVRAAGRRRCRRPLRRAPAARRLALRAVVRLGAPAAGDARRMVVRAAGAVAAARSADREPRLLRDRSDPRPGA